MSQDVGAGQGLKVFISYAHEDRTYKETLLKHLSGLTRRGLVIPWADHAIDGGQDWHARIVEAMDACHVAMLLVSPDFISSEFIHSQELTRLLERRRHDGIRVVPIITRPCHWQSEIIGQLQAMPEGGQPIVTLDRQPGGSDEAWASIATSIERWANAFRTGAAGHLDHTSDSDSTGGPRRQQPDPVAAARAEAERERQELEAAKRELQASRAALEADRARFEMEAQDIAQRRLEVERRQAEAEQARKSATSFQRQEAERLQREADAAQRQLDADRVALEAERRRVRAETSALEARRAVLQQPEETEQPSRDAAAPLRAKAVATSKSKGRVQDGASLTPPPAKAAMQAGTVFRGRLTDGSDGPEMVVIPAGRFRMGDLSDEGFSDERPVHTVRFARPFAMGRYAVSFDEYDRFARAEGLDLPADDGWGRGRRPVINVSWHDAVAYAAWLRDRTGARYRLPSEAEWEYAARAGTETAYWWGDEFSPDRANCDRKSFTKAMLTLLSRKKAVPVDDPAYLPNSWGLHQTSGNVWEWGTGQLARGLCWSTGRRLGVAGERRSPGGSRRFVVHQPTVPPVRLPLHAQGRCSDQLPGFSSRPGLDVILCSLFFFPLPSARRAEAIFLGRPRSP